MVSSTTKTEWFITNDENPPLGGSLIETTTNTNYLNRLEPHHEEVTEEVRVGIH